MHALAARAFLRPYARIGGIVARFRWRRAHVVPRFAALALTIVIAGCSGATLLALGVAYSVYVDRNDLPDMGPLMRFEFPTTGHIYDANGQPLIELARERRDLTRVEDIPPVVRDAILAAEDKRFDSHNGVDYRAVLRVLTKIRIGTRAGRPATGSAPATSGRPPLFAQGGSTITQQLVRGVFLQGQTSREDSADLQSQRLLPRVLAAVLGARNVNMGLRKLDEIRLSVWIEQEMRAEFGSKRLAKDELLARYASFVYMGNGQYGFARAADYYLGRPLSTFTIADADSAALLAGIMKAPRDYAPTASDTGPVRRRRNQILALMAARGSLTRDQMTAAQQQPLPPIARRAAQPFQSSAVIEHVLDALETLNPELGIDDLLNGQIQVYSTVDARVQRIASDALEHGLKRYEARHPGARGQVQGSVVVLRNRDGSILAETGGRQVHDGHQASYSDYNRVRRSMRQPGSAMKPIVYLAAFRSGAFTLETLVPDDPISVPDGRPDLRKWIANYDGKFKGLIPVREAFAESRNAVAIWITEQVGINSVLRTARSLGLQTRLHPYATTALGASEVNLLELATVYRSMASGVYAPPFVIRQIVRRSGEVVNGEGQVGPPISVADAALVLVQEGLRGVVRMPTGTAHALASRGFPIAVMGKTGTTNDFTDALFVGSTYGLDGITVAVRIGFDDNRSLGPGETGGRVALPVFQDVMLKTYGAGLVGRVPSFPAPMEQRITRYLEGAQSVSVAGY